MEGSLVELSVKYLASVLPDASAYGLEKKVGPMSSLVLTDC